MAIRSEMVRTNSVVNLRLVENKIDELLGNKDWVAEWECSNEATPSWNFVMPFVLTEDELVDLKERYITAGWKDLTLDNSGKGWMEGMCRITLHK